VKGQANERRHGAIPEEVIAGDRDPSSLDWLQHRDLPEAKSEKEEMYLAYRGRHEGKLPEAGMRHSNTDRSFAFGGIEGQDHGAVVVSKEVQ